MEENRKISLLIKKDHLDVGEVVQEGKMMGTDERK
jgi:hypothetical protein